MNQRKHILAAIVTILLTTAVVFSCDCEDSKLSFRGFAGQVMTYVGTDKKEAVGKAVLKLLRETDNGMVVEYETVADGEGRFAIPFVKPGKYRLWAESKGYQRFSYPVKIKKGTEKSREL